MHYNVPVPKDLARHSNDKANEYPEERQANLLGAEVMNTPEYYGKDLEDEIEDSKNER